MSKSWDEELKEAVRFACEKDAEELDEKVSNYIYTFSPAFTQRMQEMMQVRKARSRRKRRIRYLLIAAAIAMLGGTVMARDYWFEKIGKLFMTVEDHGVDLRYAETASEDETEQPFVYYEPEYIPEGYVQTEVYDDAPVTYIAIYCRNEDTVIKYKQFSMINADLSLSQENGQVKTIQLGQTVGLWTADFAQQTISFENNGYMFVVTAPLSEEKSELIKIAESIQKK